MSQPLTNGECPLSAQPPSTRRAVMCGGVRTAPENATPARSRPLTVASSNSSRRAVFVEREREMTTPWCWSQANEVDRQPLARTSRISMTWGNSSPGPPASGGAAMPKSPASASARQCECGMTPERSTSPAAG